VSTLVANVDQAKAWDGAEGADWAADPDHYEASGRFFWARLLSAVPVAADERVLDIGCGNGKSTCELAALASAGSALGVDLSAQMLANGRARALAAGLTNVEFVQGDAQVHPFAPTRFSLATSLFGAMFFGDPVAAFANLRRAARPGAGLRAVVWRSMADNPFMTAAERAAAPLLPDLPPRRPDEPGQFAFADAGRVRRILAASGWSAIDLQPIDVPCTMPESTLVPYVTQLGPVGRALQQADDDLRGRVIAAVRPAFDRYVHGAEVRFDAACWMVAAQA